MPAPITGRLLPFALLATLTLTAIISPVWPGHASAFAASPQSAAREPALPDAADIVSAYLTARRWIDAFELPGMDDPAARLSIADGWGVFVQLRRSGRVLGTSVIAPMPHIESDLKFRRALGRAMSQVLGDAAVTRLPDEMRDGVGRSLVLELEVAGPPEPLIARTFQHVARQIEPGLHGVALRRGDRWAMVFPSQLLATNGAERIAARMPLLVEELGLSAADLETLTREHNLSVYRFRTSHLVQAAPDQLPFETLRGDRLVRQSDVNRDSIAVATDALVKHILSRTWPDEQDENLPEAFLTDFTPSLLGDYRPVADRYDPLVAPPFEQTLTAFALARYANAPGMNEETADAARDTALFILERLAADESLALSNLSTCAALLYAVAELSTLRQTALLHQEEPATDPGNENLPRLVQTAVTLVASAYQNGDFRLPDEEHRLPAIPPHVRAMLAGAIVRISLVRNGHVDAETAARFREMLDATWNSAPEHEQIGLQPWIGWAEFDLAGRTGGTTAHVDRLRRMRRELYGVQVGFDRAGDLNDMAPDLHGGFVLSGRRWPDAQNIRPVIWLASMMREPNLTDPQSWPEHEARLLGVMRFLMQLTVRESAVWSLRNRERALGGMRNSSWDSDQPLAAQAMALLAFTEAIQALDSPPDAAAP